MPVATCYTSADLRVAGLCIHPRKAAPPPTPKPPAGLPQFILSFRRIHPSYNIYEVSFLPTITMQLATVRCAAHDRSGKILITKDDINHYSFEVGGILIWTREIVDTYNALLRARASGAPVEFFTEEVKLLTFLERQGFIRTNAEGLYELASEDASLACFPHYASEGVRAHEFNHGLFLEEPRFRQDILDYWNNGLSAEERRHITDFLLSKGNPEKYLLAEFAAHAVFSFYKRAMLFGSAERAEEIRQAVLALEQKYWHEKEAPSVDQADSIPGIRLTSLDPKTAAILGIPTAEQLAAVQRWLGINPAEA